MFEKYLSVILIVVAGVSNCRTSAIPNTGPWGALIGRDGSTRSLQNLEVAILAATRLALSR
jgi:hypothetical protein